MIFFAEICIENELITKSNNFYFLIGKKKDVAQKFEVQAMPTFVFVKKGEEVDRVVGADNDDLEKKIEKYRATAT